MATDIAIDLVPVRIEINIGRPTRDFIAAGDLTFLIGIDTNRNDLIIDCTDQVGIAKGFLIQHRAGWAVIAIEMDQHGSLLVVSNSQSVVQRFLPANLVSRGRGCRSRQIREDSEASNHKGDQH